MGNLYGFFQEKSILKVFKPIQFSFYNSSTLCINCAHHTSNPSNLLVKRNFFEKDIKLN